MDMELEVERNLAEQEKARMYIQYLSNIFSQPPKDDRKPDPKFLRAKEEFESLLMPSDNKKKKEPKKIYEWDFDPETLLEHDG